MEINISKLISQSEIKDLVELSESEFNSQTVNLDLTIYLAAVDYGDGVNHYVSLSEESLNRDILEYVARYWNDDDISYEDHLFQWGAEETIFEYFDESDRESITYGKEKL